MKRRPPRSTPFPYTPRFRSADDLHPAPHPGAARRQVIAEVVGRDPVELRMDTGAVVALLVVLDDRLPVGGHVVVDPPCPPQIDRKSTRLNSSHANISYAVFC